MNNKFKNIESKDITFNKNGDFRLSDELTAALNDELAGAIAGGFNPEEEENEDTNEKCLIIHL